MISWLEWSEHAFGNFTVCVTLYRMMKVVKGRARCWCGSSSTLL